MVPREAIIMKQRVRCNITRPWGGKGKQEIQKLNLVPFSHSFSNNEDLSHHLSQAPPKHQKILKIYIYGCCPSAGIGQPNIFFPSKLDLWSSITSTSFGTHIKLYICIHYGTDIYIGGELLWNAVTSLLAFWIIHVSIPIWAKNNGTFGWKQRYSM